MSRIYISSSWSNANQPALVYALRRLGHKVYDFRHSISGKDQNVWDELGINRHSVSSMDYQEAVSNNVAIERFNEHYNAMKDADTCILLLPCGRSSHAEAGLMKGMGKRVFVYESFSKTIPELMYRMFDGYFYGEEGLKVLYEELSRPLPVVRQICGCTEDNICHHPVNVDITPCWQCAKNPINTGEYYIDNDPSSERV